VPDKETKLADDLVMILMSNIEKVKSNQGFIPQANAICKNVDNILKIQRLKLDMVRTMNGKKQK
jgi:hypothetical protein